MSNNNITDEFREKWISKIYTTHFETMPEAVRWIRENITDDMEASIHLYKLATENLKEEIETLKAENSKMRAALEPFIVAARHARNFPHPQIPVERLRSEATFAESNAESELGAKEYNQICESAFKTP